MKCLNTNAYVFRHMKQAEISPFAIDIVENYAIVSAKRKKTDIKESCSSTKIAGEPSYIFVCSF